MAPLTKAAVVSGLLLLFITSFAQTKNKHTAHRLQPREEVEIDSNWESPSFFVPNIAPDKIGTIGLELSDPFNKDEALYKVFPGYHYPKYHDYTWAVWRSTKYPSRSWKDEGEGDYHIFPGKRKNVTCVSTVKPYTDDSGKKNILISFGSLKLMATDMMTAGHYYGADVSVAHFTKIGNKWVLKNFTMAVGSMGNWHHASPIDTIKLGVGNYGCRIDHEVNPPGGPGRASLHIYGLIDGEYKEVLTMDDASCYMGLVSGWGTEIKRQNTGLQFDDLKLVTTGDFSGEGYDSSFARYGDTAIDLPDEVYGQTATAYSFSFRITKTYHFYDGHYKMISNKRHIYNVVKKKNR